MGSDLKLHPKIQRAPDALATQNQELMVNPPADDYVFVGYLAPMGELVDAAGEHVGTIEPGDSVVSDRLEDAAGGNRQQKRAIEAANRRKRIRGPKPLRPRAR